MLYDWAPSCPAGCLACFSVPPYALSTHTRAHASTPHTQLGWLPADDADGAKARLLNPTGFEAPKGHSGDKASNAAVFSVGTAEAESGGELAAGVDFSVGGMTCGSCVAALESQVCPHKHPSTLLSTQPPAGGTMTCSAYAFNARVSGVPCVGVYACVQRVCHHARVSEVRSYSATALM